MQNLYKTQEKIQKVIIINEINYNLIKIQSIYYTKSIFILVHKVLFSLFQGIIFIFWLNML